MINKRQCCALQPLLNPHSCLLKIVLQNVQRFFNSYIFQNPRDIWKDTYRSMLFLLVLLLFVNTGVASATFKIDGKIAFFKQLLKVECSTSVDAYNLFNDFCGYIRIL